MYMDVITQLSAVRSSIDRVMGMIVAENLKDCLEHPENSPEEQAKKMEQAINMIIKSKERNNESCLSHRRNSKVARNEAKRQKIY